MSASDILPICLSDGIFLQYVSIERLINMLKQPYWWFF